VHATLDQIVASQRSGRIGAGEVFVSDGTGTANQDVAAAALARERTKSSGRGIPVEPYNTYSNLACLAAGWVLFSTRRQTEHLCRHDSTIQRPVDNKTWPHGGAAAGIPHDAVFSWCRLPGDPDVRYPAAPPHRTHIWVSATWFEELRARAKQTIGGGAIGEGAVPCARARPASTYRP